MDRYPILQSGFISLTEKDLTKPGLPKPDFRNDILMKEYRTKGDKFFYSKIVTELFHAWRTNPAKMKEFDFREKIIKAFLSCFATPSMFRWMEFQNRKPSTSAIHTVFLVETLDYLLVNKPRNIENVQWIPLIEYSDKTDAIDVDFKKYFGNNPLGTVNTQKLPSAVSDIIAIWTSKPQGFEDMLICLYIIFGDREQKNDVVVNLEN